MGVSNSNELQALLAGYTGNSSNYQNPNFINLNNSENSKDKIYFKIPENKFFELDSDFFKNMNMSDTEIKLKPFGLYHGQMKNDKREGKGRFSWTTEKSYGDIYEGEWKDDKMHGKGVYVFANGKRYNGDWYQGDMHGKGIMKYTDGYYEGDWVHDKR